MSSAGAAANACSVFFKLKVGARFVWRGAVDRPDTALLVSVVSIGAMKVKLTAVAAKVLNARSCDVFAGSGYM
jgi:hypothetical protein